MSKEPSSLRASVCVNALAGALCWSVMLVPYVYFVLAKRDLSGIDWMVLSVVLVMAMAVIIYLVLAMAACLRSSGLLCFFLVTFPFVEAGVVAQAVYVALVMYRTEHGDPRQCEQFSSRGFLHLDCNLIKRIGLLFALLAGLYIIGLLLAIVFWNTVRIYRGQVLHDEEESKRRAQVAGLYEKKDQIRKYESSGGGHASTSQHTGTTHSQHENRS